MPGLVVLVLVVLARGRGGGMRRQREGKTRGEMLWCSEGCEGPAPPNAATNHPTNTKHAHLRLRVPPQLGAVPILQMLAYSLDMRSPRARLRRA